MSRVPAAGVTAVEVPREIVNADSVYVVNWAVADGDSVDVGTPLCEIETSKAVVPVEAPVAGFARPVAAVGDEVAVGGLLGYVTDAADTALPGGAVPAAALPPGAAPAQASASASDAAPTRITAKAQRRIDELGLDAAAFVGRGVVREEDVLAFAAAASARGGESVASERTPDAAASRGAVASQEETGAAAAVDARGPSRTTAMGAVQRRVARAMEHSAASIPASSLERVVDLAGPRERAKALGVFHKVVVTEVDLLVHAVATACRNFPEFNGCATADHQLRAFEKVNVGVAVDVAGDLYVVVVRDVGAKPPEAVAKELRSLQYLAARRRLGVEQMTGGTITVTSMLGRGVQRFVPIPYPEQAAIVGLADPESGSTRASLVLVFDHRVAGGARAAGFLVAIDAALQACEDPLASPSSPPNRFQEKP